MNYEILLPHSANGCTLFRYICRQFDPPQMHDVF